jgi:hypothetical protein
MLEIIRATAAAEAIVGNGHRVMQSAILDVCNERMGQRESLANDGRPKALCNL